MREQGQEPRSRSNLRRSRFGEIVSVRQQQPLGLGHAVWCARDIVGDEPFAVLLPDELMYGKPNCLAQMVEAYERVGGNIVAALEVPDSETHKYGVIDPGETDGRLTEIRGMVEKPAPGTAPSNLMLPGRYILQPEVMRALDAQETGAGGEIQLTDAIAKLIGKQPFHAYRFEGERYDCGSAAGFVIANLAMALERKDVGPSVREFIAASLASTCASLSRKLTDLDRPLDHAGVERRIVLLQALERPRALDPAVDPREQHFEVEGLQDHVVGAGLIGANGALWLGFAGDQHDRNVAPQRLVADQACKVRAAHPRHVQLGQHEVDRQRDASRRPHPGPSPQPRRDTPPRPAAAPSRRDSSCSDRPRECGAARRSREGKSERP